MTLFIHYLWVCVNCLGNIVSHRLYHHVFLKLAPNFTASRIIFNPQSIYLVTFALDEVCVYMYNFRVSCGHHSTPSHPHMGRSQGGSPKNEANTHPYNRTTTVTLRQQRLYLLSSSHSYSLII